MHQTLKQSIRSSLNSEKKIDKTYTIDDYTTIAFIDYTYFLESFCKNYIAGLSLDKFILLAIHISICITIHK